MGRPRKSTAILEASGAFDKNPDRRRTVDNEPNQSGELGDPPKCLSPELVELWHEVVGNIQAGVLKKSDRFTVEMAARLALKMRNEIATPTEINSLHSLMSKLGGTPADRSRVSVPVAPTGNKFEE